MLLYPVSLSAESLSGSPLPIDLALLKQYVGINYNDMDDVLAMFLLGAIEDFENRSHRAVIARPHRWVLRCFPSAGEIRLPAGKTQSVESVAYVDGGAEVPLAGFDVDTASDDGGLLSYAGGWPAASRVVIEFTAGWLPTEVPRQVKTALFYAVQANLDSFRDDPVKHKAVFDTLETMASAWRLTRWYA